MQFQMPELPHKVMIAMLTIALVQTAAFAGGGWMMYQSLLVRMDTNVERLIERIDANGQRIDRNGELISQLRERMTAVEVRVGGLEEVVRFFHPPESELQQR